jgi:hypothetical protein
MVHAFRFEFEVRCKYAVINTALWGLKSIVSDRPECNLKIGFGGYREYAYHKISSKSLRNPPRNPYVTQLPVPEELSS